MFFNCRNRVFSAGCHLGGGGALYSHLNDTSRNETASSQKFSQTTPQNANNAQNGALSQQEQLLAGTGLGLDPENDPVVYTTDYGLEIKYSNSLTYLTDYTYFTVGGYNWVIIGYDSTLNGAVGAYSNTIGYPPDPIKGNNALTSTLDNTPAGVAIWNEEFLISSAARENDEIGDYCVLCLCELSISAPTFGPVNSNDYKGSNIEQYLNETIYLGTDELGLGLQALPIIPQKLTTLYYSNQYSTTSSDNYLFPLAAYGEHGDIRENFYIKDYLDLSTKLGFGNSGWWLRSGYIDDTSYCCCVNYNGTQIYRNIHYGGQYLRPAFVLKI